MLFCYYTLLNEAQASSTATATNTHRYCRAHMYLSDRVRKDVNNYTNNIINESNNDNNDVY